MCSREIGGIRRGLPSDRYIHIFGLMRSPIVEVSLTSKKNIGKSCLLYLMPMAASSDESISFLSLRG